MVTGPPAEEAKLFLLDHAEHFQPNRTTHAYMLQKDVPLRRRVVLVYLRVGVGRGRPCYLCLPIRRTYSPMGMVNWLVPLRTER